MHPSYAPTSNLPHQTALHPASPSLRQWTDPSAYTAPHDLSALQTKDTQSWPLSNRAEIGIKVWPNNSIPMSSSPSTAFTDAAQNNNDGRVRKWSLCGPDGCVYEFANLRKFVRENAHLFSPEDTIWKTSGPLHQQYEWCKASSLLARLRPGLSNTIPQWRGWTWNDYNMGAPIEITQPKREQTGKTWVLQSPDGNIHRFKNLRHFIRQNIHFFTHLLPLQPPQGLAWGYLETQVWMNLNRLRPKHNHHLPEWQGWRWHEAA